MYVRIFFLDCLCLYFVRLSRREKITLKPVERGTVHIKNNGRRIYRVVDRIIGEKVGALILTS